MATGGAGFPRYTTYAAGQMDGAVRGYLRLPEGVPLPKGAEEASLRNGGAGSGVTRTRIVKAHSFEALLPDGTNGQVSYERLGPTLHRFRYKDADGLDLPNQWFNKGLDGTTEGIERAGREIAEAASRDAVARERAAYFCRASESASRKKRPELYQMDAKRAKQLAGRYLLCYLLPSGKCFPASIVTYSTLDEANVAWWKRREDPPTEPRRDPVVVACCNRLDRRWETPRYNPLYKETGKPASSGTGRPTNGGR